MSITRDIEIEATKLIQPLLHTKVTSIVYKMEATRTTVEITFGNKRKLILRGAKYSNIEIERIDP